MGGDLLRGAQASTRVLCDWVHLARGNWRLAGTPELRVKLYIVVEQLHISPTPTSFTTPLLAIDSSTSASASSVSATTQSWRQATIEHCQVTYL